MRIQLASWWMGLGWMLLAQAALGQATLQFAEPFLARDQGEDLWDKDAYGQAIDHNLRYESLPAGYLDQLVAGYRKIESERISGYPNHVADIFAFREDFPVFPNLSKYDSLLDPKGFQKAKEQRWTQALAAGQFDFADSVAVEWAFRRAYSGLTSGGMPDTTLLRFNQLKGANHHRTQAAQYYAGYLAFLGQDCAAADSDLRLAGLDTLYTISCWQMLVGCALRQQDEEFATMAIRIVEDMDGEVPPAFYRATGDLLTEKGKYEEAKPYYAKLGYQDDKTTGKIRHTEYEKANSALKAGKTWEAMKRFGDLARGSDVYAQVSAYQAGLLYGRYGEHELAKHAFDKAHQLRYSKPISESATANLVRAGYILGEWHRVSEGGRAYITTFPKGEQRTPIIRILTVAMLHDGDYARATQAYRLLPKPDSSGLDTLLQHFAYLSGVAAYQQADFSTASNWFEQSLRYRVDSAVSDTAMLLMANALQQSGLADSARKVFRQIYDAPTTNFKQEAALGLGQYHYEQGAYDKALPFFREAAISGAGADLATKSLALARLGDCLLSEREYIPAAKAYSEAASKRQAQYGYYAYQAAQAYKYAKRYANAREAFANALTDPNLAELIPQARYDYGMLYFETKTYPSAIEQFTKLIDGWSAHPLIPEALEQRALAYKLYHQYDRAIADYKRLIDGWPNSPLAEEAIRALFKLDKDGQKVPGLSQYESRFKQANPTSSAASDARLNAAMADFMDENYAAAQTAFAKIIAESPNSPAAHQARYYLGKSLEAQGKPSEAMPYFKAVQGEYRPRALNAAGNILIAQFSHREAIPLLLEAEQAGSPAEKAEAQASLVVCYHQTGDLDKVKKYADLVIAQGQIVPKRKALLYKGMALRKQGDHIHAIQSLRQVAGEAPGSLGAEAQFQLGGVYRDQKNYDASNRELQKVQQLYPKQQDWISKAFIMMARNDAENGNREQAKATLRALLRSEVNAQNKQAAQQLLDELNR